MSDAPPCGLILAGGRGQRLGGRDKGLVALQGRPLIAHIAERLAPQVGAMLISGGKNWLSARFHLVIGCSSMNTTSLGRISIWVAMVMLAAFPALRCQAVTAPKSAGFEEARST